MLVTRSTTASPTSPRCPTSFWDLPPLSRECVSGSRTSAKRASLSSTAWPRRCWRPLPVSRSTDSSRPRAWTLSTARRRSTTPRSRLRSCTSSSMAARTSSTLTTTPLSSSTDTKQSALKTAV